MNNKLIDKIKGGLIKLEDLTKILFEDYIPLFYTICLIAGLFNLVLLVGTFAVPMGFYDRVIMWILFGSGMFSGFVGATVVKYLRYQYQFYKRKCEYIEWYVGDNDGFNYQE